MLNIRYRVSTVTLYLPVLYLTTKYKESLRDTRACHGAARGRPARGVVAELVARTSCTRASGGRAGARRPPTTAPRRPRCRRRRRPSGPTELVFILTDDQDRVRRGGYDELGSLAAMPVLRRRLLGRAPSWRTLWSTRPSAAPRARSFSRVGTFLAMGPPSVQGGCMHADTTRAGSSKDGYFRSDEAAGYRVGVFGEVTNDQTRILQQMGDESAADFIDAPVDYNDYDGMRYWQYWDANRSTHMRLSRQTRSLAHLTRQRKSGTGPFAGSTRPSTPQPPPAPRAGEEGAFFAYVGPHAPHFPAQPAPWYEHAFDDVVAPRTPNYNASSPGKARHVRQNPPLDDRVACWGQHFRDRWSSCSRSTISFATSMTSSGARRVNPRSSCTRPTMGTNKASGVGASKQHPCETDIPPRSSSGPASRRNFTTQISGNVDVMPTMLHLAAGKGFSGQSTSTDAAWPRSWSPG